MCEEGNLNGRAGIWVEQWCIWDYRDINNNDNMAA